MKRGSDVGTEHVSAVLADNVTHMLLDLPAAYLFPSYTAPFTAYIFPLPAILNRLSVVPLDA